MGSDPYGKIRTARSLIESGDERRALRLLESARSELQGRGDVEGIWKARGAAAACPASGRQEKVLGTIDRSIAYLEGASPASRAVRARESRGPTLSLLDGAVILVYTVGVVWASLVMSRALVSSYPIWDGIPRRNLVEVALLTAAMGAVGGLVVRPTESWFEVPVLGVVGGFLVTVVATTTWPTTEAACGSDAANGCEHYYAIGLFPHACLLAAAFGVGAGLGRAAARLGLRAFAQRSQTS